MRDLIRGIQNLRKESGFNVTDRIRLQISGDSELEAAQRMFSDFIASETLCAQIEWKNDIADAAAVEADDKTWRVRIEKA